MNKLVTTSSSAGRLAELSLENAERWFEDAKLLGDRGSCGHANALLRFAFEEFAKAFVCWQVSEKLIPENSKPYRDVFKRHPSKNEIIIGFLSNIGIVKGGASDEAMFQWWGIVKDFPNMMEKFRQLCVYVGFKDGQIHTPHEIGKNETEGLMPILEYLLRFMKRLLNGEFPEYKEKLKEIYAPLPREVWETGFVTRNHLAKMKEGFGP